MKLIITLLLAMLSGCGSADRLLPRGPEGREGVPGKNGEDGSNGENGIPGKDGLDGKDGADGQEGSQGPQGPAGPQGESSQVLTGQGNLADCEYGWILHVDGSLIIYQSSHSSSKKNSLAQWKIPENIYFSVSIDGVPKCVSMIYLQDGEDYYLYYKKSSNNTNYRIKLNKFSTSDYFSDQTGETI